jgi:hypothetical protein
MADSVAGPRGTAARQRWSRGHVAAQLGTVTEHYNVPSSSLAQDLSPREVIHALPGANRSAGANPSARLPAARCTAPRILFSYYTMGSFFSAPDRACLRVIYSKNHSAPGQAWYNKVVH